MPGLGTRTNVSDSRRRHSASTLRGENCTISKWRSYTLYWRWRDMNTLASARPLPCTVTFSLRMCDVWISHSRPTRYGSTFTVTSFSFTSLVKNINTVTQYLPVTKRNMHSRLVLLINITKYSLNLNSDPGTTFRQHTHITGDSEYISETSGRHMTFWSQYRASNADYK